jgi:predicted TIM-barrel fold metal-dependent hydrolase
VALPPVSEPPSAKIMQFVDAHHHLWDLGYCHYPWLMAQGVQRFFGDPAPIQKNYLVDDLVSESRDWRPAKSVHIQVGAEESDSLKESQWLQQVADSASSHSSFRSLAASGLPNAIVAFVDLAAKDAKSKIDQQAEIANVKGVRQIVGRHPDEDRQTGTDSLVDDPALTAGLRYLAQMGMSFDLQLIPPQYDDVWSVFSTLPELPVAICHCGSPWDQSPAGLEHWRHGMRRFAELPNIHCKISGLGMFKHDWSIEEIQPLVLDTIEIFGTRRVMFGSNFPVDKLYGSYERIWNAYDEITSGFSTTERADLFSNNAEVFYRI